MWRVGVVASIWPLAVSAQVGLLRGDESERLKKADPQEIRKAAGFVSQAGTWSVTYRRPEGTRAGIHDFYSSQQFTANGQGLHAMCDAVLSLGVAAWMTGETSYTQRAAKILDTWFLAPGTYMNPDLDFSQSVPGVPRGRGFGVIDGRDLIWCAQGLQFAERAPGWNAEVGERVRGWYRRYLCWLLLSRKSDEEKNSSDYHAAWWAAQVAMYADFVSDDEALAAVWKLIESGKAHLETAPEALCLLNRIGQNHGQPAAVGAESTIPGSSWDRILQALTATPR